MSGIAHFHLAALITSCVNIFLVIFVRSRGRASALRRRFVWYGSSIVFWSAFLFLFSSVPNPRASYIFCQLLHVGAIFIPCFFLHLSLVYLKDTSGRSAIFLRLAYVLSFAFLLIDIAAPQLFISEVVPKLGFPYFMNGGPTYVYWVVFFFLIVIYGHAILLSGVLQSSGSLREQRMLFLVANLIGYMGGVGVFFPVYDITFFPFPYGAYGVVLFSTVTAYSIVAHGLLDIEVIVKRTLVFAGLFGFFMAVVGVVTALAQSYIGQRLRMGPAVSAGLSVLIAIVLYDPVRKLLVHLTDRFLFQKKEDFRKILNRLSSEIITILDLDRLGETILSTLEETVRIEAGAILLKNEDGKSYRILNSFGFKPARSDFSVESELVRFLSSRRNVLNLEDQGERGAVPVPVREVLEEMRVRVCMPLFLQEELIGVLALGKKKSDEEFKPDEIGYFPTLTGQAAVALSNARLYDILKKSQADFAQQAKMAAIGTLSAGIGHEIKNPLAAIRTGVEMLKLNKKMGVYSKMGRQEYEAVVDDVIERVLGQVERAAGVMNRLSDFSKKPKELKIEPIQLEQALDSALELVAGALQKANIVVQKNYASGLPKVSADFHGMEEVFLNLLVNASHAMREGGTITLSAFQKDSEIHVTVRDSGQGIPKENLEKIFDPFFTTKDTSRGEGPDLIKGTGLGLFIVSQIVKRCGGRVVVESVLGRGTTFEVALPALSQGARRGVAA